MQAIFAGSFVLFCVGSVLFGAFAAHVQFYRFAAADTASLAFRSRAISLVLAGGLLAAFLGPELAKWSRDLFAPVLYAGGYLFIALLALTSLVLLQFIEIPRPGEAERRNSGRPLRVIASRPDFRDAAGRGCARPSLRSGGLGDPVARGGYVRSILLHRPPDPPFRRRAGPGARRVPGARLRRA
jgi:hypothetical protein